MAVKSEDINKNVDYLSICTMSLSVNIRKLIEHDEALKIAVRKRNKHFTNGDFIVIPTDHDKNCLSREHSESSRCTNIGKVIFYNMVSVLHSQVLLLLLLSTYSAKS